MTDADLGAIANDCGFNWPDDADGQRRVLIEIAKMVQHWRSEVGACQNGIMKERWYSHLERRYVAIAKKLHNVRRAAIEYKAGRDFDELCRRKTEDKDAIPNPQSPKAVATLQAAAATQPIRS